MHWVWGNLTPNWGNMTRCCIASIKPWKQTQTTRKQWFNKGICLYELKRNCDAATSFLTAVVLFLFAGNKSYFDQSVEAAFNLGVGETKAHAIVIDSTIRYLHRVITKKECITKNKRHPWAGQHCSIYACGFERWRQTHRQKGIITEALEILRAAIINKTKTTTWGFFLFAPSFSL